MLAWSRYDEYAFWIPCVSRLGLGISMVGAIHMKMSTWKIKFAPSGSIGWEYDLILLASCILLLTTGAGMISLDSLWFGW